MKILYTLIAIAVVMIVLGSAVPVLWPLITATSDNITAMEGTDTATSLLKSFWPIIILVVGFGMVIGLVIFGLRKFGLMGKGSGLNSLNPLLLPVAGVIGIGYLAYRFGKTRKFTVFRKD